MVCFLNLLHNPQVFKSVVVGRELESPSVLSILYVDTVPVILPETLVLLSLILMFFHAENLTEAIDARERLAEGVH